MALEAPYSKYKLQNYMIYVGILVLFSGWMVYDGYLNQKFIEKHTQTNEIGVEKPDVTLVFHKKAPFILIALAAGFAVRWFMVKDFKITADDEKVIFGKRTILIDTIEKIDKTHFASKGYFIIYYKDAKDGECTLKLSDRVYDKLNELLDHIAAKMV
jgi:hypothetical protein